MPLNTDREKGAHLLRRFGLGASEAELDFYLQDGLNGAIDRLLDFRSVQEPYDYDLIDLMAVNQQGVNPRAASLWWVLQLVTTRRPLQEKMTLFWHDHFATSAQKVASGAAMYNQVQLLRGRATSDFKTILTDVSKDAAMLFWLDNQFNVKGKPNENFAREVMELFTLGEGNGYTEEDIREAARAFTGWSVGAAERIEGIPPRGKRFVLRTRMHDNGEKSVLGRNGPLDGDDVIGILCGMERTSAHLVEKLWEWFAYPKPEPALLARLSNSFRNSGLSVSDLLRDIMRSSEFYSKKAERAVYKNPVDFVVPTVRQLGLGAALGKQIKAEANFTPGRARAGVAASQAMQQMGMQLLYPPDVAGWEGGAAWITSATMVARIGWADRLFGVSAPVAGRGNRAPTATALSAYGLFESNPTSSGVVQKLVSLFDAPMKSDKIANLESAARKAMGGGLNETNANQAAAAVSRLIFASPEFQFS